MGSRIWYLKDVELCVVLQAQDKFEVDCHTDSVSLCLESDWGSLDLFEPILEKNKYTDFGSKYGHRCYERCQKVSEGEPLSVSCCFW